MSWSRWARRGLLALLVVLLGYAGESLYATKQLGLPMESVWMLQRFRLGYAPLPTFVRVKPGSFKMGEQDTEFRNNQPEKERIYWGAPIISVTIEKGFSLSVTEVTFEQFDYYIWARPQVEGDAIKSPSAPNSGRGNRPVVNVSWNDAMAYANWLGARTTQRCRLPTEAEWEYAARAGDNTVYLWGNKLDENKASCKDCGGRWGKGKESAPVRRFSPNKLGLYDMSGNASEWTCSRSGDALNGEAKTCADSWDNAFRALRGGSWLSNALGVGAAAREYFLPGYLDSNIGFRVLCETRSNS